MIEFSVQFGVVAVFGRAFWSYVQMLYAVQIRIRNGEPELYQGKVSSEFVKSVRQQCKDERIRRGWIGGISYDRKTRLKFSGRIPAHCQRRLRN